jgi:hypothetical protein
MNIAPKSDLIFVFGSNIAGRHGAGAALFAEQHRGAKYGQGMGLAGQSWALPTKDEYINTLPIIEVFHHVNIFKSFAKRNRDSLKFQITRVGCGLAGFSDFQIAPMFEHAPYNCVMPVEWAIFYPNHEWWAEEAGQILVKPREK